MLLLSFYQNYGFSDTGSRDENIELDNYLDITNLNGIDDYLKPGSNINLFHQSYLEFSGLGLNPSKL